MWKCENLNDENEKWCDWDDGEIEKWKIMWLRKWKCDENWKWL